VKLRWEIGCEAGGVLCAGRDPTIVDDWAAGGWTWTVSSYACTCTCACACASVCAYDVECLKEVAATPPEVRKREVLKLLYASRIPVETFGEL
jgi:hypothetical protein